MTVGELNILGDVDQNGTGAAAGRDVEPLVDRCRQTVGFLDQPVVFRAGAGDAHGVGLLEGIVADHERRHLTRQNHQRDAVQQRVGQTGHRVGRAGARGHQNHTGFTGRARIALSRMNGGLFVAHQNVADFVLLENLVVNRKHSTTGVAENHFDALILKGLNHHFSAGHGLTHFALRASVPCSVTTKKPPFWRGRMGYRYGLPLPAHAHSFDDDD